MAQTGATMDVKGQAHADQEARPNEGAGQKGYNILSGCTKQYGGLHLDEKAARSLGIKSGQFNYAGPEEQAEDSDEDDEDATADAANGGQSGGHEVGANIQTHEGGGIVGHNVLAGIRGDGTGFVLDTQAALSLNLRPGRYVPAKQGEGLDGRFPATQSGQDATFVPKSTGEFDAEALPTPRQMATGDSVGGTSSIPGEGIDRGEDGEAPTRESLDSMTKPQIMERYGDRYSLNGSMNKPDLIDAVLAGQQNASA